MNKTLVFIKKHAFVIAIVIAIIIKHILTINLPVYARDEIGADEYLMLCQAENLIKGMYLGSYNYLTLVKGIGFPLFLTLAYKIGISYLSLYSIFYSFASLVALIPLRKMIKNKFLQFILFIAILFCPATFDYNVQLVYRNMLILPQSILLVSSLMMVYYNIKVNTKKSLLWIILASFSWVFMWHTREDSIWSLPVVIVTWIVLLITIITEKKRQTNRKKLIQKIAIITLPFILLFLSIQVISAVNYRNYGIYTTNQLNDSNYTKAVMLMMKVKPEKEIEHVTITRETLLRLYEVSPTLAELKDIIENDYINKTGLVMAEEDNGEINEDLITWTLTGAASALGYYKDAKTAEAFWGKVYDEIKIAIDNGDLETRTILPSRSLIPFPQKEGSLKRLISSIGELYIRAAKYENSIIVVNKSSLSESVNRRYETISGGYIVRSDTKKVVANGCIFSKDNDEEITIGFEDEDGQLLKEILFSDSPDIYDYYKETENEEYEKAKKCRYVDYLELEPENNENIYIVARNEHGEIINSYNLMDLNEFYLDDNYNSIVDHQQSGLKIENDPMEAKAIRYVTVANNIKNLYSSTGVISLLLSLMYYFGLTIYMIVNSIKKKNNKFDRWLFLSAILGATTVILIGLGYVNAFMVDVQGYIASCNGLLNLFIMSAIFLLIQDIIDLFWNKVMKKLANAKNKNVRQFFKALMKKDTKKLFRVKTNNVLIQFFRYIWVGGIAAIVNIGMLYVFTDIIHLYYLFSNVLSFTLGLLVNYILSKKFVFQEKVTMNRMKEFIIYAIIGIIGLGIDTGLIWVFTSGLSIYYLISKIISTMIVFIWNFVARKIFYKIIK